MVVLIETTYDKVSSNWSTVSSKVEIMHGGGVVLNEEGYDTALQVVPPRTKKLIVRLANLVFKKKRQLWWLGMIQKNCLFCSLSQSWTSLSWALLLQLTELW